MNQAELRCIRESLGLSQAWMAAYLGVNPRTYRRYEDDRDRGRSSDDLHPDQVQMVNTLLTWTRSRMQDEIMAGAENFSEEYGPPTWVTYRTDFDAAADGIESAPNGPPLLASWHRALMFQVSSVLGGPIVYWTEEGIARPAAQEDAGPTDGTDLAAGTQDGPTLLEQMDQDAQGTGVTWTGIEDSSQ